jgi:hypothetical protein
MLARQERTLAIDGVYVHVGSPPISNALVRDLNMA